MKQKRFVTGIEMESCGQMNTCHASWLGDTRLFYDSFSGPAKPSDLTSLWQSHCRTLTLSKGDCTLRIKRIWLDLIRLDEAFIMRRQHLSSTASPQSVCGSP